MSTRLWQAPWGYYWKVVVDPTRSGEDPGMFYGGHFRWSDIELPPACKEKIPCPWPSGTVFENVKTGERVVIKRGKAVRLEKKHGGVSDHSGVSGAVSDRDCRVHVGPR